MDTHGRLLNQQLSYETFIQNKLQLQLGDKVQRVEVIQRSLRQGGITVGTYGDNLSLNSIVYVFEFPDETIREYTANISAENMLTQVDEGGYSLSLMKTLFIIKKTLRRHYIKNKNMP